MSLVTHDYKDGFSFTGLTTGTAGPFTLLGGKYGFCVVDTGTPQASLQLLGPDGTTYINVTAVVTTNGYVALDLVPGTYRVGLGTGTSLSAAVAKIYEK